MTRAGVSSIRHYSSSNELGSCRRCTTRGVSAMIVEVEAYGGPPDGPWPDAASHSFRGRRGRNTVMFGPAGRLYTYRSHGIHVCANVVVGVEGDPGAVLVRAGEVVAGLDTARSRRPGSSDRDLARGPARLCRALAIDLGHDGVDLRGGPVVLEPGERAADVSTGPRVGLRQAADRPWRFWVSGDPTVSPYRPAAPLKRRT